MANELLTPPTISTTTGGHRKQYTVYLQDLKNAGAVTTIDINLGTLPAGAVLLANRVKHSTAVAGTSFSASTARLFYGTTALGSGTLDVFAAIGNTDGTHAITGVTPVAVAGGGDLATAGQLMMRVTSTGGNLSATTAGQIDAWVEFVVLK